MTTSSGGSIGNIVSFKTAGAYSTKQYYPVKLSADNTVSTCSAVTDLAIGILQNKPEATGATADVLLLGGAVSKVMTAGTIAAGADLYIDASTGAVRAALSADDANSYIIGKALEAATASGDIITAILNPTIGTTS